MSKLSLTFAERTIAEPFNAEIFADEMRSDEARAEFLRNARATWHAFRITRGFKGNAPLLTPPGSQFKLRKSDAPTFGLMLVPARTIAETMGAKFNVCPGASTGCEAACIATSGKGRLAPVQYARRVRTEFLFTHPAEFAHILMAELRAAIRKNPEGIRLRMNVVSDIRWELATPALFDFLSRESGGMARAYDYTAFRPLFRDPSRVPGYSLTYSRKESTSDEAIRSIVGAGANVAVAFSTKRGGQLPATYLGYRVIDGDISDDRTNDPRGVIVGLRAKGDGIGDETGFIVPIETWECGHCGRDIPVGDRCVPCIAKFN